MLRKSLLVAILAMNRPSHIIRALNNLAMILDRSAWVGDELVSDASFVMISCAI